MNHSAAAPRPVRRAAIASLGCKVNVAEMEAVARLLRTHGAAIVQPNEAADLIVVNTCTVTTTADAKSRQVVRQARRSNPDAQVFVTGCSVAIDPDALTAADPQARLFGLESKDRLLDDLAGLLEPAAPPVGLAPEEAEPAGLDRTRAFVKIQDGCSFHCTYCLIPRARGPERSVPPETVIAEARHALATGRREVVLTGINAGTYDGAGEPRSLAGLVARLLAETQVERIRLSSIEPQHVTGELLRAWSAAPTRCLPHFHVPLQSGDDTILRRMGRRYNAAFYAEMVARVRRAIPGVAMHADVIAGFPGEDEAAWQRTMALLRDLDLAGIHVFRYSERPGTAAERMVGAVDERTKKRRAAEALDLAAAARARFAAGQRGRELRVLFEQPLPGGRWLGHAENHVLVEAESPDGAPLRRRIGLVRAESIDPAAPDRLVGRLLGLDGVRQAAEYTSAVRCAPREPLAELTLT